MMPLPPRACVGSDGVALDVAPPRDGHHDVLVGDEVLVGELLVSAALDARAAILAVPDVQLAKFVADDLEDPLRVGEDVLQLSDPLDHGHVLVLDLLALQGGQAAQLHLEDGVGLDLGETEAAHEVAAGRVHVGRLADGADDGVQVVERGLEAFEDVGAVARLLRSNSVRRRTTHPALLMVPQQAPERSAGLVPTMPRCWC
jgi:hypothetical protein